MDINDLVKYTNDGYEISFSRDPIFECLRVTVKRNGRFGSVIAPIDIYSSSEVAIRAAINDAIRHYNL